MQERVNWSIELTAEEHKGLSQIAAEQGSAMAAVVRRLIRSELMQRGLFVPQPKPLVRRPRKVRQAA